MITVIQTKDGFQPIGGNPTIDSLDGEIRAPLQVLLQPSWTDEERAKFGVYLVEPFEIPEGKQAASAPTYEMRAGQVVQVIAVEDVPPQPDPEPTPLDELRVDLEALTKRVTALEGKAL